MSRAGGHIAVCPAGKVEPALLAAIAGGVSERFGIEAVVSMELSDLMFAHNKERNQYHSTAILEKLSETAPPSAVKVIAVTHVDLFIPILTYVHGEAQLGGRSCIISTFRLKGDERQEDYIERMKKEAVHELCHTFDLRHCKDPTCVMHFCRNAKEVDRRSDALCRYCFLMFEDKFRRLAAKEDLGLQTARRSLKDADDRPMEKVTPLRENLEEEDPMERNPGIVVDQGSKA